MPKTLKKPVSIRFDDEAHETLRAVAAQQDRSIGSLVRRIVNDWVKLQDAEKMRAGT